MESFEDEPINSEIINENDNLQPKYFDEKIEDEEISLEMKAHYFTYHENNIKAVNDN